MGFIESAFGIKCPAVVAWILYGAVVLALYFYTFAIAYLRLGIWEFDGVALSRGLFRGLCVPLCDIESIRLGMPPLAKPYSSQQTNTLIAACRENALVLVLRDGRLLPLYLAAFVNGEEIHQALLAASTLSKEPYSAEQRQALSGRSMNVNLKVPE